MSPIPWSFSYSFPSYDNVSDISGGHSLGFGGVFGGLALQLRVFSSFSTFYIDCLLLIAWGHVLQVHVYAHSVFWYPFIIAHTRYLHKLCQSRFLFQFIRLCNPVCTV